MNNIASRRFRNGSPSIMIAPLVDLIFTLLIFFMLVSTYITPSIKIELPKSQSATRSERKAVAVTITREGAFYFEGRRVTASELQDELQGLNPSKVIGVRVRSDRSVPIETIVNVIDMVRVSPVKNVELEVRQD